MSGIVIPDYWWSGHDKLILLARLQWLRQSMDAVCIVDWLKVNSIPVHRIEPDYLCWKLTEEQKTAFSLTFLN